MSGMNSLVGSPVAVVGSASDTAERMVGQHPMAGGYAAGRLADNPPLVLALVVLGSVAVLAALNAGGFRGVITVGKA